MATSQFTNGYALLIAVNDNLIPNYALPAVARDAAALRDVLVDPDRCAYPAENVRLLNGPEASRAGIREGIAWLKRKVAGDRSDNATAVLYYTGHGAYNRDERSYYFLPYDVRVPLTESMIRAEDLAEEIEMVRPRRMLVILDCCHAGGMGIKGEDLLAEWGLEKTAAPPKTRSVVALMQGQGRAVLSSSSAAESSYIRADRSMSIFTYHLVEALTGFAQPEGATEVLVSDVMGYVSRAVPKSAMSEYEVAQTPVYQVSGENFPVALILGGQGVPKGRPLPTPLTAGLTGPSIHTNGGAYVTARSIAGSDFSNGKTVNGAAIDGQKNDLSGNFTSSAVNIGSELNRVCQSIVAAPAGSPAQRAELHALVAALQAELDLLPSGRSKEADAVVKRLARVTDELGTADPELVAIESQALVRAAYSVGDVRPGVPAAARQIAAAVSRMA